MDKGGITGSLRMVLIDDEPAILRTIAEFLRDQEHTVETFGNGAEALAYLEREEADIVISDIKMAGMDGFQVLEAVRRVAPQVETVLITGHGDIGSAVRALREGAFDFFTKPLNLRDLMFSLQRTSRFHALRREKDRYKESLNRLGQEHRELAQLCGGGPGITRVKELIQTLQETDATTVMIAGESGTGKELVARAIHYGGRRAEAPFVSVNCTALPETLIESELYGHEKGAFTDAKESRKGQFELAEGGSVFLDEIGDMSLSAQAKVLRTLEEREVRRVGGTRRIPVDVRVISATNKDLRQAMALGEFRADLYYRLNTFVVRIPPLRERPEDIGVLAAHFLARYSGEMRKEVEGFAPEALDLLQRLPFPGNVRELRNLVERAVILCRGRQVVPADLLVEQEPFDVPSPTAAWEDLSLARMERELIGEALRRTGGNQVRAAEQLDISRDALRRRIAQYGLGAQREG